MTEPQITPERLALNLFAIVLAGSFAFLVAARSRSAEEDDTHHAEAAAGLATQAGERDWRKRAKENFYDPLHELQMFGDLLEPRPDSPPAEHPGKGLAARRG